MLWRGTGLEGLGGAEGQGGARHSFTPASERFLRAGGGECSVHSNF